MPPRLDAPSPAAGRRALPLRAALRQEMLVAQAQAYARAGRLRTAAELLLQSVRRGPASAQMLDLLARIYAQGGDGAGARATWELALEMEPQHEGARRGLRKLKELMTQDGETAGATLAHLSARGHGRAAPHPF